MGGTKKRVRDPLERLAIKVINLEKAVRDLQKNFRNSKCFLLSGKEDE